MNSPLASTIYCALPVRVIGYYPIIDILAADIPTDGVFGDVTEILLATDCVMPARIFSSDANPKNAG